MYKRKSLLSLFIGLMVIFMTSPTLKAQEATSVECDTFVRVGLTTYYNGVDYLHIFNKTILPGYLIEGVFVPQALIQTPSKDVWFSAATKLYLESDQTFETYALAYEKVKPLREAGYKAYATLIGPNLWKVFAGHKNTSEELNGVYQAINTLNGVTYFNAPANEQRIIMESYDQYPVMFENRGMQTLFSTSDLRGTDPIMDLGKRSYRGYQELWVREGQKILPVNVVELNDYLYSVVVSEIYASWPSEALKAQSVAARTFATYYSTIARKYPGEPFCLDDTVNSQVYKGYSVEDTRVNAAVDATQYEMIYFDNTVIPAYFFSSSGGRTENSENVWSGTVPYLKSVPDIYEQSPEKHPWIMTLSPAEIGKTLSTKGINIGQVLEVKADGYSPAGRVMTLKIIGSSGSYDLVKETMRYWLGFYSRKFMIIPADYLPKKVQPVLGASQAVGEINYDQAYVVDGSGTVKPLLKGQDQVIVMGSENIINQPMISGSAGVFTFAGEGYGHGVGMSQSGAKGMALEGFTYLEILKHYYTGIVIK